MQVFILEIEADPDLIKTDEEFEAERIKQADPSYKQTTRIFLVGGLLEKRDYVDQVAEWNKKWQDAQPQPQPSKAQTGRHMSQAGFTWRKPAPTNPGGRQNSQNSPSL